MVIDLMNSISSNILTFAAAGFFAKRISNHYENSFRTVQMAHEERKLKMRLNAKNKELAYNDLKDAREKTVKFGFSRKAIVISIFWLSAIILFACAYLSIPIIVPIDSAGSLFWGLFQFKTTTLQSANGFLFDYKTIAHQAVSIISFFMGCSVCKG